MTYSPYTRDGKCKERADVAKDIAEIAQKGFATVRLYGTDCKGLENVGDAVAQHNLKIVVGVFIDNKGLSPAHEQVQALVAWGRWGLVELVVIGNEALFNGYVTASQLAAFIGEAKQKFRQAGYAGPCTTTEASVKLLHDNRDVLCPVIDVVAANLHPYFNPKVTAAGAGEFVAQELKHLAQVCPGKDSYTLETGWPSGGQPNGAAVPGEAEQRMAIHSIEKAVGGKTIFFTYV
jgi:exo-beta-1,3-glucanase (GH17 family)